MIHKPPGHSAVAGLGDFPGEQRGLGQHSLEDERDQSNGLHSDVVLLVQGHGHNAVLQGNPGSVTGTNSTDSTWTGPEVTEEILLGRKMF